MHKWVSVAEYSLQLLDLTCMLWFSNSAKNHGQLKPESKGPPPSAACLSFFGHDDKVSGNHILESNEVDSRDQKYLFLPTQGPRDLTLFQGHLTKEGESNVDLSEETFLIWNMNFKLTEDLVNCNWIPPKEANVCKKWLKWLYLEKSSLTIIEFSVQLLINNTQKCFLNVLRLICKYQTHWKKKNTYHLSSYKFTDSLLKWVRYKTLP